MSDLKAVRISKFRDKHERQLLSIMAQSIACSACLAEGNSGLLRTEMDALSGQILELVEEERRVQKRAAKPAPQAKTPSTITMIARAP